MPSLFKFLFVTGTLVGSIYAGLFVLATRFEPEPMPTVYRLQDVKAVGPAAVPETAELTEPSGAEPVAPPSTPETPLAEVE